MKRWITALGTLATMVVGCAPIVFDGVDGTGGGSSSGPSGSSGSSGPSGPTALAMRFADVPAGSLDGTGLQLPATPDPDALVLFFASEAQQCAAPIFPSSPSCAARWQLMLYIPSVLDLPGPVDLSDPRTFFFATDWLGGGSGGTCAGGMGEGPGVEGTLDIVSSDPTSLSITLSGVNALAEDIDGTYTAQRCDAAPPTPPLTPALAILGSKLLSAGSSSSSSGGMVDPTALYVFAGTAAATCQDPWSFDACAATTRLAFSLPASLQQPGTINLADPAIAATYAVSGDQGCGMNDGSFMQGTIDIVSIDAGGVSFKVFQSEVGAQAGVFEADGLYAASVCP